MVSHSWQDDPLIRYVLDELYDVSKSNTSGVEITQMIFMRELLIGVPVEELPPNAANLSIRHIRRHYHSIDIGRTVRKQQGAIAGVVA